MYSFLYILELQNRDREYTKNNARKYFKKCQAIDINNLKIKSFISSLYRDKKFTESVAPTS